MGGFYFNPRSPHGERQPVEVTRGLALTFQSTLPARGATKMPDDTSNGCFHFNPRSPHGERLHVRQNHRNKCAISIHAPRTGSDQKALKTGADPVIFQSTLPARGATCSPLSFPATNTFQSTLPARGATEANAKYNAYEVISIHAPRTGSDYSPHAVRCAPPHFNPRSPHGERLGAERW